VFISASNDAGVWVILVYPDGNASFGLFKEHIRLSDVWMGGWMMMMMRMMDDGFTK
jgi:hypothetical protein